MTGFAYTLLKQSGGRPFFARVEADVEVGGDAVEVLGPITVRSRTGDPPSESLRAELVDAAHRAARYAWTHADVVNRSSGGRVQIREIEFDLRETTPNALAYACCHAVWGALGTSGRIELRLAESRLTLSADD